MSPRYKFGIQALKTIFRFKNLGYIFFLVETRDFRIQFRKRLKFKAYSRLSIAESDFWVCLW
jgi:hypothetical protein